MPPPCGRGGGAARPGVPPSIPASVPPPHHPWRWQVVSGGALLGSLLRGGEQHTGRDGLHRLGDLPERGEGRGEADVAVARVVAEGERRAGRRESDTGLLGELHHAGGGAVEDVEADEVATLRAGPGRDAEAAEALGEHALHLRELRGDDLAV